MISKIYGCSVIPKQNTGEQNKSQKSFGMIIHNGAKLSVADECVFLIRLTNAVRGASKKIIDFLESGEFNKTEIIDDRTIKVHFLDGKVTEIHKNIPGDADFHPEVGNDILEEYENLEKAIKLSLS